METLRIKEIDGEQIIIGFDKPVVDPEATKKRAVELLQETNIYKRYIREVEAAVMKKDGMVTEINEILGKQRTLEQKLKISNLDPSVRVAAISAKHPDELDNYLELLKNAHKTRKRISKTMSDIGGSLQKLTKEVNAERKRIIENNPVYFEPRAGEIEVSQTEIDQIKKKLKELKHDEILKRDGKILKYDRRNARNK